MSMKTDGGSSSNKLLLKPLKVVLDMDETLVHVHRMTITTPQGKLVSQWKSKTAVDTSLKKSSNTIVRTTEPGTENTMSIEFIPRPDLREFFEQLQSLGFKVCIWTAADKVYADAILNRILPRALRKSIPRYYKHDLIQDSSRFVKDLSSLFSEQEMQRVVLVDDHPWALEVNPLNCIQVPEFVGTCSDNRALLFNKLITDLKDLNDSAEDVRKTLAKW
eukprot:CAMPEP_0184028392 /NCGR_PEP_ID=MMETSP0954-20121128/14805_1 /TAXON_ID=627963 /ORGANISM="Aplanochytrium sp, Strain PBS07" /LENGTH=218 /DNA_ID=CAMNT_0026313211 /DNA_START=51 /DNA_END=704 /DNA_ORIENTATION=-